MTRWKPDGWEATTRIGVLAPHADLGPEAELQAMAPSAVTIHATRVPFGAMATGGAMDPTIPLASVRAFAEPPHLDDAAELLAAAPLSAIAYGFTSSAYVIGIEGEAAMIARLQHLTNGIPVVAPCAAMVEAMRAFGAERVALVDPPWFDGELSDLGRRYYESAGFEVVRSGPAICRAIRRRSPQPPSTRGSLRTRPRMPMRWRSAGNGLRAVGVIDALEKKLDRLVISANQALFWAALRSAGADPSSVTGYGRLFEHSVDMRKVGGRR